MCTAELVLAPEARSAGMARRFLSERLVSWHAPGYAETATLVLSELVTNAALHARTNIAVRVHLSDSCLRLEVADGSDRRPVIRHYSPQATTGRGLGLVDCLAERWGVVAEATGKTVWVELVNDELTDLRRSDQEAEIVADLAAYPDLGDESADPTSPAGPVASRGPGAGQRRGAGPLRHPDAMGRAA